MYMDDFDPYSPKRRAERARQALSEKEAFRKGFDMATAARRGLPVYPHATPPERELPPPAEIPAERGVWEERSPFLGTRSFTLSKANGDAIANFTWSAELVDERVISWMWRILDRYEPVAKLHIV